MWGFFIFSYYILQQLINGNDDDVITDTLNAFKDGAAVPLPDFFFMYNAFLEVRPRIHAIAVKKIS